MTEETATPKKGMFRSYKEKRLKKKLDKLRMQFFYDSGQGFLNGDDLEAALEFHHRQYCKYEDWREPVLKEVETAIIQRIRIKYVLGNFASVFEWFDSFSGPSLYYIENGPIAIRNLVNDLAVPLSHSFEEDEEIWDRNLLRSGVSRLALVRGMFAKAKTREHWAVLLRIVSEEFSDDIIFDEVVHRVSQHMNVE